jgi:lipopolysaccharide transport system ATP-binding protein
MIKDIAISVRNLSKQYKIGNRDPYIALRDIISNPFEKRAEKHIFWALKDVNFDVHQGEVIGVIGKNGSGKSTLLKILTRITPPTEGEAIIKGRVASLLEVGTGFNPELTGRENIFLNGAILGMTQKEIRSKFDEIVDFSGVETFLDTPVKRYSSGMYVRLAFAVAAHLESEILLVDEVLAVGDIEFQEKCLGKMKDVSLKGRTVLFVSHNMSAIKNLCDKAFVMSNGNASEIMSVDDAVNQYQATFKNLKRKFPIKRQDFQLNEFIITQSGDSQTLFDGGKAIEMHAIFELKKDFEQFRIGFDIKNKYGELISRVYLSDWNPKKETLSKGLYRIICSIPAKTLVKGIYYIEMTSGIYGIETFALNEETSIKISIDAPADFNVSHRNEIPYGYFYLPEKINLDRLNQ